MFPWSVTIVLLAAAFLPRCLPRLVWNDYDLVEEKKFRFLEGYIRRAYLPDPIRVVVSRVNAKVIWSSTQPQDPETQTMKNK
jgi:hypothetical protein